MNTQVSDASKKLAENPVITLVARFLTILISIFALPTVVWVGSNIIELNQTAISHKIRIEQLERDAVSRSSTQAAEAQALTATLSAIQSRLAQIETSQAVQTQQYKEIDRRLENLSKYLENRLGIQPSR